MSKKYPLLMCPKDSGYYPGDNLVVMFFNKASGVVVQSDGDHLVGNIFHDWDSKAFEKYTLTVFLANPL